MKKKLIRIIAIAAGLLILFVTTDPQKLPSFVLILPFVAFFVLIFFATKWLASHRTPIQSRATRLAILCASLPTLLIVLMSLGQLTVKDVATTVILLVLSYFYIARNALNAEPR